MTWPTSTPTDLAEQIAAVRWAPEPYPPYVPTGHIVQPAPTVDKALVGTIHDPRRNPAADQSGGIRRAPD